jgi:methyl-accepting chemotaxis protein
MESMRKDSETTFTEAQTVASSAEELTAAIDEIAQQVHRQAEIAQEARAKGADGRTQLSELAQAAEDIGRVVDIIQGIASQTEMLALNATIEAARAGEAGKGFAVVASEVKDLAAQTARATEQISERVTAIRAASERTVEITQTVGETVEAIGEISNSIASATEEQSAATREIAASITRISDGTGALSQSITAVAGAAGETDVAARSMQETAHTMSGQVQALKELGDSTRTFLARARAG